MAITDQMQIVKGEHKIHVERVEPKKASFKEREADHIITISNTECGLNFRFLLKGYHLEPMNVTKSGAHGRENWYTSLTDRERVDLMQTVLAHYREDSMDKDGMKTASIGIVKNPDPNAPPAKAYLAYVSFNTNDSASDYLKGCAERNTIEQGRASMRRHMVHHYTEKEAIERNIERKPAKYVEFHVMGGRDPDPVRPGDRGVPAICPCGQCTDRLASEMVPGGKVYIYPYRQSYNQHTLDHESTTFSQVRSDFIWATNIEVLNRHRRISLSPDDAAIQEQGLAWIADQLVDYKPVERSAAIKQRDEQLKTNDIDSISELDVATTHGELNVEILNHYLHRQVLRTLAPRLRKAGVARDKEHILDWINENVKTIRVVVLKTDDGHYHMSKDSRVRGDNAYPNAESSALSDAVDALGEHGVEAVYALTLDPQNIKDGIVRTLSKDGLERIYKRNTKLPDKELFVSHMLLNDNSLSRNELHEMLKGLSFNMDAIYPSHFAGNFARNYGGARGGGSNWAANIPKSGDFGIC